ncbi:MAG TPA: putative dsRNA-binding protein, partial [Pseudonocardiaceae bacterium]|nr:putative dsRNA-binding protein [Pseudonocardiaceae bacterium]
TAVIAGVARGVGKGRTKKEAEQHAAETAWRTLSERPDENATAAE